MEKLFLDMNDKKAAELKNWYALKHTGLMFSAMGSIENMEKSIRECYETICATTLNPDKMAHHLPSIYGLSLEEPIRAFGDRNIREKQMIILIDKDYETIVDYKIIAEGDELSVQPSNDEMDKVLNWLQKYRKQEINAILMHNHPESIACIPSDSDRLTDTFWLYELNQFQIRLMDSMIISNYDCYSQRQYEIIQLDQKQPIEHNIFHVMDDKSIYEKIEEMPLLIKNAFEIYQTSRLMMYSPAFIEKEEAELNELRKLYKKEESK